MTEAQDAGNYSITQHQANVVALGDGENPGDERHAAIMARITRILSAVANRPVVQPAADVYFKEVGYFFR